MEWQEKLKNMLQQFSWQQFGCAVLILCLVWYGLVFSILYWDAMVRFFRGETGSLDSPEPLPHSWVNDYEPEDSLLGKPNDPVGESLVNSDEFSFQDKDDAFEYEEETEDKEGERLGIVPDVLEEIKSIFSVLQSENGTKEDFFSLFKLVSSRFPQIRASDHLNYINEFIAEHAPFELSKEELMSLWD